MDPAPLPARAHPDGQPCPVEARLISLDLTLPMPPTPMGAYSTYLLDGDTLYVSGHGPRVDGVIAIRGKLGADVGVAQGCEAARVTCLNLLATVRLALGDLCRVRRVLKVTGFVNCTPEFGDQPAVVNGASELLRAAFGDAAGHARSAIGVAALPNGIPVEVEMVLAVRAEVALTVT